MYIKRKGIDFDLIIYIKKDSKYINQIHQDILKYINLYGPTEATSAVSAILITKEMADNMQLLPVGEVETFATEIEIINNEIYISSKESGKKIKTIKLKQ